MSNTEQVGQESFQVVSDLAQLRAFVDPLKTRILRVLQQQEATVEELAADIGEPESIVRHEVSALRDIALVRTVSQREGAEVYRATARVYSLRPEPGHKGIASASINSAAFLEAHMDSITREVVASASAWPDQRSNYEGRRAHMSYERAMEFNERLVSLVNEYWGGPDQPVREDPNDPVLAFVGFWYRFPETPVE